MKTHDLENVEELQGVYLGLEKAVKYYDDFFDTQLDIEVLVRKMGTELVKKQFAEYDLAFELTENAKNILRAMRAKDIVGFENKLEAFDRIFKAFAADFISKESYRDELNLATRKAAELKEIASKFYYDASIPKEQKLYGKFYFYHNFEAISTTNKYSNGFVNELNTILTKMNCPKPLLFEEPHYFRVIYPQKLETEEYLTSYDDNIQVLPEKLKERNIVTATHKIVVDSIKLNMRLYDPKIQDGDIVSINYNGDWIIENVSLEKNAKDLKVKLNKVGKNYLLIHAESIGSRPPNTVAISYFYQGKKEVIALEVDLDTSQIIEIDFRSK